MDKQYVIVLECSTGNDSVGNMWLETYICKPETTIEEIIKWKEEKSGRGGRLMITEASKIKKDDDIPF